MGKKIRFPLKLAEGAEVRTLEELREHFDLQAILEYYKNGQLLTWLEDRYLEGEAAAIQALDESAPDFQRRLCEVFQVEYKGNDVDLEAIERRQERLKRLRSITDDAEYIQNIDQVAFDQEELADLLDEGEEKIYLCGEHFTVPASRKGVTYIGINNPTVHISGKVTGDAAELGIEFTGIACDNLPHCSTDSTEEIIASEKPTGSVEISEDLADKIFNLLFTKKTALRQSRGILAETDDYFLTWEAISTTAEDKYDPRMEKSLEEVIADCYCDGEEEYRLKFFALDKQTLGFTELPDLRNFSVARKRATFYHANADGPQIPPAYKYGDTLFIEKLENPAAIWMLSLATGELKEVISGVKLAASGIHTTEVPCDGKHLPCYKDSSLCVLDIQEKQLLEVRYNGNCVSDAKAAVIGNENIFFCIPENQVGGREAYYNALCCYNLMDESFKVLEWDSKIGDNCGGYRYAGIDKNWDGLGLIVYRDILATFSVCGGYLMKINQDVSGIVNNVSYLKQISDDSSKFKPTKASLVGNQLVWGEQSFSLPFFAVDLDSCQKVKLAENIGRIGNYSTYTCANDIIARIGNFLYLRRDFQRNLFPGCSDEMGYRLSLVPPYDKTEFCITELMDDSGDWSNLTIRN